MSKFDTDPQCEEVYGTFKGEPASEDGCPRMWRFEMPEEDDILFDYPEERHD